MVGKREVKNSGNSHRRGGGRPGDWNEERRRARTGTMEEKSEGLSSTAELSDLVCYQQELSGARAEITGALFTHTYPEKHTHAQS